MLSSDRYKAMQNPPQAPSNPEYDYLQAKATGYGDGGLFSNIGASHHQQGARGAYRRGKATLGGLLGFAFVMAAAILAFVMISERTNDMLYAVPGAFVAMYIAGKVYAIPLVTRLFSLVACVGLLLGLVYLLSAA